MAVAILKMWFNHLQSELISIEKTYRYDFT